MLPQKIFNQIEGMKKSISEIAPKAAEVLESPELKSDETIELIPEEIPEVPPNASVFVSEPTSAAPVEDPKILQARAIAEKMHGHPHGTMMDLPQDEEAFKNENYDLLSKELINLKNPKTPESPKTDAEMHAEILSASRS